MSLVSFGGVIFAPDYPSGVAASAPTTIEVTVDADGEGYGMVFHAPATGLITGMGAPTAGTVAAGDAGMIWQLESVDVSATPAKPSGTIISAGVVGNTNPSVINTWYDAVFGTSYSATKGELLAAVIKRPTAGSFNGRFRAFAGHERGSTSPMFPYLTVNAGAGWIANQLGVPAMAINYGGTYHMIRGSWPMLNVTTTTINNTTTPDVVGARWIPRFKCRVYGVWVTMNSAGAYVIKFYDTDGVSVLASATVNTHERAVANQSPTFFPFSAAVEPTIGATYWIGVEPSSATNVILYDYTTPSTAIMAATALGGDFYFDSAKDPSGTGSWTGANALRRPFMGLQIDQLDDGAGGGGGGGGVISRSLIAGGG